MTECTVLSNFLVYRGSLFFHHKGAFHCCQVAVHLKQIREAFSNSNCVNYDEVSINLTNLVDSGKFYLIGYFL